MPRPIPAAVSIGKSLAPSPTAKVCVQRNTVLGRQSEQRLAFGLASNDRRPHGAGDAACDQIKPVGDHMIKTKLGRDLFGKDREPARNKRGHSSLRSHCRDQFPGARRQPDASGRFFENAIPHPREQPDTLR